MKPKAIITIFHHTKTTKTFLTSSYFYTNLGHIVYANMEIEENSYTRSEINEALDMFFNFVGPIS